MNLNGSQQTITRAPLTAIVVYHQNGFGLLYNVIDSIQRECHVQGQIGRSSLPNGEQSRHQMIVRSHADGDYEITVLVRRGCAECFDNGRGQSICEWVQEVVAHLSFLVGGRICTGRGRNGRGLEILVTKASSAVQTQGGDVFPHNQLTIIFGCDVLSKSSVRIGFEDSVQLFPGHRFRGALQHGQLWQRSHLILICFSFCATRGRKRWARGLFRVLYSSSDEQLILQAPHPANSTRVTF